MTPKQEIFEYLLRASREYGLAPARDAANSFLKLGMKAVNEATPRKANKEHKKWTEQLWRKQGGICARGKEPVALKDATLDHVIALVQGGKDEKQNCQMTCGPHNSSKGGKDWLTDSRQTGEILELPEEEGE